MSKNIDIVYKDTISTAEKKRLMIAFYAHTATSIKEMIMLILLGSKRFEKKIKLVGVEHYTAAVAHNKGVLLLTGHLGNWEFSCSIAVAEFQKILGQFKFCVIRRTIKTKWIDKIIRNHCEACHVSVIKSRGARQKVPQALKEGYGVYFAIDQHASLKPHVGVPVNFFGRKAGTYMGLAENVQHNQTPVVPLSTYRQNDGTHVVEFHAPLRWQDHPDFEQSIHDNTQMYNQVLETMILAHPEQWL